MTDTPNAWGLVEDGLVKTGYLDPRFLVELKGPSSLYGGMAPGDWVLASTSKGAFSRLGRILRVQSTREGTTIYFDRFTDKNAGVDLGASVPKPAVVGSLAKMPWSDFIASISRITGKNLADVPLIEVEAYIRELLQLAVMDDVHGPAGGPTEEIVDMGVRDRYLVGKLAPRQLAARVANGDEEAVDGIGEVESDDEPGELVVHEGRHDPGADFDATSGRVDVDADAADDIGATTNQSLVPSSFGMTFCVDGGVDRIDIEAWWGRYERVRDHNHAKRIQRKIRDGGGRVLRTEEVEVKLKVWKRVPCGGKATVDLATGAIDGIVPDPDNPDVRIQGIVRDKNEQGDRLVTLFLLNGQDDPEENKDAAWVFQPELIVHATAEATAKGIFRRKVAVHAGDDDEERKSLEMIYRKEVEFAVGHGIAVHATTDEDDLEKATAVQTVVMPQYEVPVTETPGLRLEDRAAMRAMVVEGHLDMDVLAAMEKADLVQALAALAADYAKWIGEQEGRIGHDVVGHDRQAKDALGRCKEIEVRLREGIDVLTNDPKALTAFRFANRAMARQRLHSMYALSQRRRENKKFADFDIRKNRSWRPFQLAFILLAIPALADPLHRHRAEPLEATADLLWFPTGGGKTEAYLGVAAFAMAIRRLQGNLGGYDGSRGLTVVMRYTLRLLTLQQFQRSTTLICAMETLRQKALAAGDNTLGETPFTIGLWVGNKVTPGTTADSASAIRDIRNPERFDAGGTSPAQLTSCPWCGSEISPKKDVEVYTATGRTAIYCGDPLGRCTFSKGRSSDKPHQGIPVLVVDEELYRRPPSMMIATVDKYALMAWRGDVRNLFGRVSTECPRHGFTWPGAECTGTHRAYKGLPGTAPRTVAPLRPPDLIVQDEFHLISGPLGTMVGLYEAAIDDLCSWKLEGKTVLPKIVASTATVRKAREQVANVFMRPVAVFPPHGLDVGDNFFSVQRPTDILPGRRYVGVCSPGSSRPAVLIRMYTAFLAASQALFDRFGSSADPYMTTVGYFNSLRELGGMKRLTEDDIRTRTYRVEMSAVKRPGLAQRSISDPCELTSRIPSRQIPKNLDQLEIKFKAVYDKAAEKFVTTWEKDENYAIDVVLATNMLSVGVDVNRLGLMVVNGQPKGTAEYIQATSRVGRSFPGLVCTVLTWARPRDLSHYETFEHFHATFYKHVEAQSVTPFSPRAMDRGLTGALLSVMRLENPLFSPNVGAGALDRADRPEAIEARDMLVDRAWRISHEADLKDRAKAEIKKRLDLWAKEAGKGGRTLSYEKNGPGSDTMVALLKHPGIKAWDEFTVPMSMREVEPGVRLVMSTVKFEGDDPEWTAHATDDDGDE